MNLEDFIGFGGNHVKFHTSLLTGFELAEFIDV
jgi:hypothetical protein